MFTRKNKIYVLEDILDTKIADILIKRSPGQMDIGNLIFRTPEGKEKLKSLGMHDLHFYDGRLLDLDAYKNLDPRSRFENVTIRELLNKIVKLNKDKFWLISRWGNKGEFVTVLTS